MPSETVYKPVESVKPIYTGGTITPPKFMPSLYEWLSFKGTQIVENKGTGTAFDSVVVYTIPQGYTFFLTTIWLITRGDNGVGASTRTSYISFGVDVAESKRLLITSRGEQDSSLIDSINYSIPVRINEGQIIWINNGSADAVTYGGITGFLVKNSDVPAF